MDGLHKSRAKGVCARGAKPFDRARPDPGAAMVGGRCPRERATRHAEDALARLVVCFWGSAMRA